MRAMTGMGDESEATVTFCGTTSTPPVPPVKQESVEKTVGESQAADDLLPSSSGQCQIKHEQVETFPQSVSLAQIALNPTEACLG